MIFNEHSKLEGQHAFLSASKYNWLNYDDERLASAYLNSLAALQGVRLHAYAKDSIKLGQKLARSKKTLNMYVNDAIGYKMTPEQVLYYSDNCFGTTDAIAFRNNFLRIHDYKSGYTPAHMDQLMVYAGLFCLEYKVRPEDIGIELRIYQNNEIVFDNPEPEKVRFVMDRIRHSDKVIEKIRMKEGLSRV